MNSLHKCNQYLLEAIHTNQLLNSLNIGMTLLLTTRGQQMLQ